MEELLLAATLKQQLDALRPIDREQENKIMQKFRLDWNYHSNNLEGNSLTYGETKALLFFGVTAQGKPLKDHFEVTGHNEAINMVIDVVNGDYPLTQNFIRELHTLLLKEPYQVDAQTPDGQPTKKWVKVGEYKSSPNHVRTKTGEMFYFATPEETPSKMADLIDWYNEHTEEANLNPILLAAEFHYKFIRIHPFDDGNGRTARILMNFILMKFGFPPVIIKTEDKENYFAALRLADVGELDVFVNYITKNLVRSLEIMLAGARGENIEEPDDIDKEIALLDKRLKSLGENSSLGKNSSTLSFIIDNVVSDLYNEILQKSKGLIDYYLRNLIQFEIDGKIFNKIEIKNQLYNASGFTLQIVFKKFTVINFGEFNYTTNIKFKFYATYYNIYDQNENILLQKPYGISLSKDQLDKIATSETKRHLAFIEQKTAEKENDPA